MDWTSAANGTPCLARSGSQALGGHRQHRACAAPEIETLVLKAVREHLQAIDNAEHQIAATDHDLIERHVERIVVKPGAQVQADRNGVRSRPFR